MSPAATLFCTAQTVRSDACADPALWLAWARTEGPLPREASAPACPVPAMLRRRLTSFGRTALSALADLSPRTDEPIVFASSWGDISRSFALLESLVGEGEVSPAGFSSSVHNAVPATACIWLKNHSACRAVAGGPVSAAAGLLECRLALSDFASVLLVCAEDAMPEAWGGSRIADSAPLPLCWAARFEASPSQNPLFELMLTSASPARLTAPSDGLTSILQTVLGAKPAFTQHDAKRGWTCTRR